MVGEATAQEADTTTQEAEGDQRVYDLYVLSSEEIAAVKNKS